VGRKSAENRKDENTMGCLCNIFDDSNVWIIILVLLILYWYCNGGFGCGNGNGCGCGC
jgi:hypothetical protein